jgi:hypothetical protein
MDRAAEQRQQPVGAIGGDAVGTEGELCGEVGFAVRRPRPDAQPGRARRGQQLRGERREMDVQRRGACGDGPGDRVRPGPGEQRARARCRRHMAHVGQAVEVEGDEGDGAEQAAVLHGLHRERRAPGRLELDQHPRAAADDVEHLAELWHLQPPQLVDAQLGDRSPAGGRPVDAVVVDHGEHAVARAVDVALHGVHAERQRVAKGGEGVLGAEPGAAAVADDVQDGHPLP